MAIMMDQGVLNYLSNLLKKGGTSTLELDGRICYVEAKDGKIAFTPTNKTRETHDGTIEFWNRKEADGPAVCRPSAKKSAKKPVKAAKKTTKKKPAAKKKK